LWGAKAGKYYGKFNRDKLAHMGDAKKRWLAKEKGGRGNIGGGLEQRVREEKMTGPHK